MDPRSFESQGSKGLTPADAATDPLPEDEPIRHRWIWWVYVLLYAVSIPWYLPVSPRPPLWFGLPFWVVLSLGATVAIAVFTAWVVRCFWHGSGERRSEEEPLS